MSVHQVLLTIGAIALKATAIVVVLACVSPELRALPKVLRARRRLRQGRCVRCGYELQGLAVCPECGDISRPA